MKVGILTVSDRSAAGERADRSGPLLEKLAAAQGWRVTQTQIVPDEAPIIQQTLIDWADSAEIDLILTTGGTGFARRDITPEATLAIVDKRTPGLTEAMRSQSLQVTPHAMLSRAEAGIRGRTLIVNLPGSPKAAKENFEFILPSLPHAVALLRDDEGAEAGHRPHRRA